MQIIQMLLLFFVQITPLVNPRPVRPKFGETLHDYLEQTRMYWNLLESNSNNLKKFQIETLNQSELTVFNPNFSKNYTVITQNTPE